MDTEKKRLHVVSRKKSHLIHSHSCLCMGMIALNKGGAHNLGKHGVFKKL